MGTDRSVTKNKLLLLIDTLEDRVSQCEVALLDMRLKKVSDDIDFLEYRLGYDGELRDLSAKFVEKILAQYSDLLRATCAEMSRRVNVPYMDRDDFMQESLEYLLRWCFPVVKKFSTDGKMWLPYIKRSIHNCFINILKKHMTKSRYAEIVDLSPIIEQTVADPSGTPYDDLELGDLVAKVVERLSRRDCRIFLDVLEPPDDLRLYIQKRKKRAKSGSSPRRILAGYYGCRLSTINSVFSRIKEAISLSSLQTI